MSPLGLRVYAQITRTEGWDQLFSISKQFDFSAAHYLVGLPEDHPCSRLHGHNYSIKVVLESPLLDMVGFVRDYRELDTLKQWLDRMFDHRCLNGVLDNLNPTAENLAYFIYTYAQTLYPEVHAVGVSETPKTWAWFTPQNLTLDTLSRATEALPEPARTNFEEAIGVKH